MCIKRSVFIISAMENSKVMAGPFHTLVGLLSPKAPLAATPHFYRGYQTFVELQKWKIRKNPTPKTFQLSHIKTLHSPIL
jgi:hypothetical protein